MPKANSTITSYPVRAGVYTVFDDEQSVTVTSRRVSNGSNRWTARADWDETLISDEMKYKIEALNAASNMLSKRGLSAQAT